MPPILNRDVIDEIIPVTDDDAIDTARALAAREGVSAGISAGAAVWAALQVAERPESSGKRIVTVIPRLRRALHLDALLRPVAAVEIQDTYPLIVTERLAEARDFYVKWLDMEVTFELDWVVYVSRPAGGARTGVCFMAPDLEHQIPEHRTPYSGDSVILTFQVEDARRELDALRAQGVRARRGHPRRALGAAALHDARPGRRLGRHRPADRPRPGLAAAPEACGYRRGVAYP